MSELSNYEQEFVALGAALASNCVPCIEYHIPEARKAGLSDAQIREAVKIADRVRRIPARMVLQAALARLEEKDYGSNKMEEAGCGCSESSPAGGSGCTG